MGEGNSVGYEKGKLENQTRVQLTQGFPQGYLKWKKPRTSYSRAV